VSKQGLPEGFRFVPDRMVAGPYGQPVLESGYTEISGIRIYPDRLVVGPHGQPIISRGRTEVIR
jgi:hypothetical protein